MTKRRITLRQLFFTGFIFLIPIGVSYWFFDILITKTQGYSRPFVRRIFSAIFGSEVPIPDWVLTIVSVLIVILFVILIGALANMYLGKKVLSMIDKLMLKLPLVRGIYGGTKQIIDAFSVQKSGAFKTVVMIEYPKQDSWVIGFLTSDDERIKNVFGQHLVSVFVPSTPNPTTGFLLFLNHDDVYVLDMNVEEAVKLIVSGGVVLPSHIRERIPAKSLTVKNQEKKMDPVTTA